MTMHHRALWILGFGLTALACASGASAPSSSKPPADDDTAVDAAPASMGGKPTPHDAGTGPEAAVAPDAAALVDADVTSAVPPDAEAPDLATPGDGPSAPGASGPHGPYTCSLVTGIQATGDWFNGGFEKIVDGSRWELMSVHSGFIDYWADPKNGIWGTKPSSACTKNADNPDRVIFTALSLHWENISVDAWVTRLTAVVKNFQAKYSNLKNVELETFVRSPGDKACPLGETFRAYDLTPADEAFQKMAAMFPELVTVAPKVAVDSCDDYENHPPHLTSGPAARAAMKMGAIYKD